MDLDRKETPLSRFAGKHLLFINSGLDHSKAPEQLGALRDFLTTFKEKNPLTPLQLIICPSNQFGNQSGSFSEIQKEYNKYFSESEEVFISAPLDVNGQSTHPLFKFLRKNSPLFDFKLSTAKPIPSDFSKFLVTPQGNVIKYIPGTTPIEETLRSLASMVSQPANSL